MPDDQYVLGAGKLIFHSDNGIEFELDAVDMQLSLNPDFLEVAHPWQREWVPEMLGTSISFCGTGSNLNLLSGGQEGGLVNGEKDESKVEPLQVLAKAVRVIRFPNRRKG